MNPAVSKRSFETDAHDARKDFRDALVAWFSRNAKDYPWRRTREPYEILVSEVMLQQTQIATVLGKGYFTRFLSAFPDAGKLAVADDATLLKAWEGLGYYRRARMLRETARAVMENHGGEFPSDRDELMKLPGIGRYTAGALRAFAFDLPAVLVDGNVLRVLSRMMDFHGPVDETSGLKLMWQWAEALADPERARLYHAGLMELGQAICRPGVPDCLACPVARFCRTREPERLPVKSRKTAITDITEHAVWLRDAEGRLLLHHESGTRRTGLWKLPVRDECDVCSLKLLTEQRYPITRYRVTLKVYQGRKRMKLQAGDEWVDADAIDSLAMAAPFRRVAEHLLKDC